MRHPHDRPDIASFYHLSARSVSETACQGTACFVARRLNPSCWLQASLQLPRVYCLGKCFMAPASGADEGRPNVEIHASQGVILDRIAHGGARTLAEYSRSGAYPTLEKALGETPEKIIRMIEVSGLRGRGGAGFPTGRKWRAVSQQSSAEKFVIANADEGDPGAYVDRFILEEDPHCLLEALAIAGYAVGASKGYVYLRNEYPKAHTVLQRAIAEARAHGMLGAHILESNFSFDVEEVLGLGSYVCGEETALISSIEGKRPEVSARPPYPTERGLYGKPTLVNNVETLATIPWIVANGGDAYQALGFSKSRGTKVVSLNSLFRRPGLYEVEFGISIHQIVYDLGGGLKTDAIRGVMVGGPLAGIIPPHLFDTPFGFEQLRAIGASVGHGGFIAFDARTSIPDLVHHVFAFGAHESCGKCTPCRLGSRRVERILQRILENGHAPAGAKTEWTSLVSALAVTSLCGLGVGLAEFADSVSRYYGEELEPCFR
ncbi:MAG: NADH-quinone oxidoreductase subunit D [Acidobacteria bacterium]|nr:NADH-quinone oxidoreductase subunit D [Acidobacteriota bacterium]